MAAIKFLSSKNTCHRWDSIPRPLGYESNALATAPLGLWFHLCRVLGRIFPLLSRHPADPGGGVEAGVPGVRCSLRH